jgi:hypothetical protein
MPSVTANLELNKLQVIKNPMEQDSCRKAETPSASQENPHILRKSKFQYRVQESPRHVPYLKSVESASPTLRAIQFRFISVCSST